MQRQRSGAPNGGDPGASLAQFSEAQGLGQLQLTQAEMRAIQGDYGVGDASYRREQSRYELVAAALETQGRQREGTHTAKPNGAALTPMGPSPSSPSTPRADGAAVVDVSKLHRTKSGPLRRQVVDAALKTQDQDNTALLQEYRRRLDAVGLQLSQVEVRFEHLNVSADVRVGNRGMPTVFNTFINTPKDVLTNMGVLRDDRHRLDILRDVSAVLRPGRFTLLLGPPGSGKTTLLKALAGLLQESGLQGSGSITYNGEGFDSFEVTRTSAYISQVDDHVAQLTVRETMDFAARCLGTGHKGVYFNKLREAEAAAGIYPDPDLTTLLAAESVAGKRHHISTDLMLRVLGLEVCADTLVGGPMLRGVSGGQRKRVTIGEMLVGPAKAMFMDEISTGLDASTTQLIVSCVRNYVHLLDATVLMALLQPPPEVFDLFDDVMLLSDGQLVFHGPREEVVPFFSSIGFAVPERKGVADFLQEVTSRRDQEQYWSKQGEAYAFVPVAQMAEAYAASGAGKHAAALLAAPPGPKAPPEIDPLVRTPYALSGWGAFKACMRRELTLLRRNGFLYAFKTFQCGFVALIAGTLFLKTTLGDTSLQTGNIYLGLIFYSIINVMFNGYAEMGLMINSLSVFYKHRQHQFFPAWAFALPTTLVRIPYSICEGILYSVIAYWLTGLAPNASTFFIYMGYLVLCHTMAIGMFRLMGALGRDNNRTNTFGSFVMVLVILLGGFVLRKSSIHPWWVWFYWVSPLTYVMNALSLNEMSAPRWQEPTTIDGVTQPLGHWVLQSYDLPTESYWMWMPALVLVGYAILFNLAVFAALAYLPPPGQNTVLFSEDYLRERELNRVGHAPTIGTKGKGKAKEDTAITVVAAAERAAAAAPASTALELPVSVAPAAGDRKGGMHLPFKPMSLAFRNISYYVDLPAGAAQEQQDTKQADAVPPSSPKQATAGTPSSPRAAQPAGKRELQLLHDITGSFRPGVLTALMGVSGAGKTTLMDVLAGRKTTGRSTGDIWVDGYPKEQASFARVTGYVEQTDVHSPRTTVAEALLLSCILRLYQTRDRAAIEAFSEAVLDLVELQPQRDALVGIPGEFGLSLEQRKRLTIGVELVANPSIVFMDEPTSGLDARAAAIVMRAVRNTVDTGRTVVCTIHQPSIDIFESFDELLLLKRGGRCMYQGPTGTNSAQLVEYFQSIPGVPACANGLNPASWMLDASTVGMEAKLGLDWGDLYETSKMAKVAEDQVEQLSHPAPGTAPLSFESQYAASFKEQLKVLCYRSFVSYWRNPGYNGTRFIFCIVLGFFLGTIYLNMGTKKETANDLVNVMGALFICITFLGTSNSSGVMPVVGFERPVFYRERAAGMYSPLPFIIAQGVVELPYILVQTVLYSVITYFLIRFEFSAAKFFWYLLFSFLTLTFFTFYGMQAVSISPSVMLAAIMGGMAFSIWFLLAGFFIPYKSMPPWWGWFYWLNPLSYCLYGIITSQLGDDQTIIESVPGQFKTVQAFLEDYLGFYTSFVGWCVLIMVGFILMFWVVVVFAYMRLNFNRR